MKNTIKSVSAGNEYDQGRARNASLLQGKHWLRVSWLLGGLGLRRPWRTLWLLFRFVPR